MSDPADSGEPASLTEQEARERAALLEVERYDVRVDLRDLLEGERWQASSTITFTCRTPGASSFVDVVGEVTAARLNDVELDLSTHGRGRLPLPDLAADNVLVVDSVQADTGSGNAILRSVDPQDGLVYVWSSFEPDGARRAWACFDQPDLKAVHGFQVSAPSAWTVLSNTSPDVVLDREDGGRLWNFEDTPRLSTYVVVVNAGPFHEQREEHGDHDLGLYCRQSLRTYLERDAEEIFRITAQGLAFFGEQFARPFPQRRYDHVFVPDFGGAMENWGCVTCSDSELYRSPPTYAERAWRALLILHEMAHQWFGDLVTMRWWDDVWLNEAFASFASAWASVGATEFTDAWAAFLAQEELPAYQLDAGPATHPIRGQVSDESHAFASFDAITYYKGQAVLRQLMALVGEETFVEALRHYFADHAWANATLDDLMGAVGAASGRDLTGWTTAWLDQAGTDTLSLIGGTLLASSPDGGEPRPHALRIGSYERTDDGLRQVALTDVETSGTTTRLDLPVADLHLVNDGDLTFASVRTDERSLEVLLSTAASLPDPVDRALAVCTAWDLLYRGELSTGDFLDCVLAVLATEPSPGVVQPFFELALDAAEQWSPAVLVPRRLARLADVAAARAQEPDHRTAALQTLAAAASSAEHFELLDAAAADDHDLAWRVQVRRASLGRYDAAAVADLLERDPDPDAQVRAWGVEAARPTEEAKAEAWERVWRERAVPAGLPQIGFARAFWRPAQHELLLPWAHRYLDELTDLSGGLLSVLSQVRIMRPRTCDEEWLARAEELTRSEELTPVVRTSLVATVDTLTRVLGARS
ncbi:aminopeptidase N [Nocardioides anomalus]|uniref:Aminopeptidase N n=1 Tax=Nocardioides anomalus TaxID=2712223 RepID=A0A6G6WDX0_9ACTN|nr:aminopeptidase N [Nocardioides anomalus]QIG43409.1 aminopeptidase N [Nocardioides anomalus]